MKRPTFYRIALIITFLFIGVQSYGQSVTFTPEFDQDVRGDILLIGNNILGPNNNDFNDDDAYNHEVDMQYIDIDGDASTFSSSSASLEVPIESVNCYEIIYAGLYWGAVEAGSAPSNTVKFRGPSGGYNDITGTSIYDDPTTQVGDSYPYAYFADVTGIVTGLATKLGPYTVANVSSNVGETSTFDPYNGTGLSAGWSLFVVYEDPTLSGKSITSFNGFEVIRNATGDVDVPVSGFRTIPTGPVRANFAFATLEGDSPITGDFLEINGTPLFSPDRPNDNFFNSTAPATTPARVPNSSNTLGFDTDIIEVPNPGNGVIDNGDTSATVTLGTNGDTYFQYFFALAVEIIEPNIVLTKIVEDDMGVDVGGQTVGLGQALNYVIGFQNTGNDDATNFTIRDILPINIVFDYPADLVLPAGVTVLSYDATTREIVFSIENYLVEQGDPVYEIRIETEVVQTCSLLADACSNIINNQAFSTYQGTDNPNFVITDDPSFSTNTGCLLTPQATNFLADLDDCVFSQNEILCGDSLELTAANGYDSYAWYTNAAGTGTPIGTDQTLTITATGTYYVFNTAVAPCQSIVQEFVVTTFGGNITNPVIPFADQVVICPNDGEELPNIFLCGANDFTDILTNVAGASSIIWEQLDETSCPAVSDTDCANTDASCVWNQIGTGPNYTANTSGQFRLTINFDGGCFAQFYFNVYQNLLAPTAVSTDIICTTPGSITVNDVPSGYEYSIDNINWQASNVFSIPTAGIYTVYIRQVGIPTNPCVFTVPDIQIRERDFTVSSTVTQPLCNGDRGSIQLAANDVEPQYTFTLTSGGTPVSTSGLIIDNNYTFTNLNPGTYTATVETEDGCLYTEDITITEPPILTVTAAITSPLTCSDGEITIYPVGGTPGSSGYFYFVNGVLEDSPVFVVTTAGTYNITVVDSNNCSADTTIIIDDNPLPTYTVSQTDILCYNDTTGEIQFNVTNANGYTIEYSIDNGVTFVSSSTFSNLSAGDYDVIIRYTLAGSECLSTVQTITIVQPDAALTATAGISELAGCGPSGEGTIRITNPQGGTPFPAPNFYEYSIDNTNWQTSNEFLVSPGTYTVYIRDANGCIFVMQDVILDQEPPAPTIEIGDTIFNCDGSGNATVTVTNNGGPAFTYDYFIDGIPNPNTANPQVFLNVPTGSHTISVEYTLLTVPTFSNLLYETFGYGEDTTSPGMNPIYYCFERQVVATQCQGSPSINDGDYSVTSNIEFPFGAWINPVDYTPPTTPPTPDGRFLVVNIGATIPATEILYEKQINDIIPNQPIQVEFAAMNLLNSNNNQFDPDLRVALVDGSGTEISFYNTGDIPKTENWVEYPTTPITLDPGANTSLKFILRSNVQQTSGNDVAIDDLRVFQLPAVCTTTVDFPFIVPSGNAFSADITGASMLSCDGADDGTITIAAQNFDPVLGFQYSINGGAWITQMTSPHTITGLADGTYNIEIRYDDSANTCQFPFTQIITAPDAVAINVTNTPVTCIDGATITATATGGTQNYSFELIDTVAPFTVTPFLGNGTLTNVPAGTYTVEVTDALGCMESTTLTLDAPDIPTATISTTSNLCYDPTNGATIEVTASGGMMPYQYNINGGAFQSSNIFNNLTPNTYIIIVRDAFGCEVTLPAQTIEPQLTLVTVITKDLDCTANPDAVITGTITGGTAPFDYAVSINGGAYTSLGTTGTPFTYSTPTAGTFQFQITDALGCITESQVNTIDAITTPTATANGIDPLCFNDANGEIQITPAGGSGGYTISFNGSPFTTDTFYDGLDAISTTATTSDYTYQIQDSNECLSPIYTITLNNPTEVMASATISNNTNCSTTTEITVTASGGTGTYTYSFNGSGYTNTNTLTVTNTTTTQTITYSVSDGNGCIDTETIDIPPYDPLTGITFADSNVITCNDTTTDVTVTPTNGVAPFAFEITAPASAVTNTSGATTGIFTNLSPDDYTFQVTDANGCIISASHTINPAINIVIAESNTDQICFGSDDGTAVFTMTDVSGVGNFTYTLTPAGGTVTQTGDVVTFNNLPTGTYTFDVTDTTTGCTDSASVTIDPVTEIMFTVTASNINCNSTISTISFPTLSGGTGGYTYAYITTGAPAPAAGDYSTSTAVDTAVLGLTIDVYVMDSNGCVVMNTVTIISDVLPTVTASVDNQCTGTGNDFTITATGTGLPTLTYSIDGTNFQNSNTFTVIPGTYTITIRDTNGCEATDTVTVYPQLTLSAVLDKDITCSLPQEAQVTLTANGGNVPAYTYEYSTDGGGTFTNIPTNIFTTTTPGSYIFMVTDANSCTAVTTTAIDITPAVDPDITVAQTGFINCNGEETASISITPDLTLGLAPYVFDVVNTTTGTPYGTQTSGLPAGDYTVTVTDANGCTEIENITISQPDPIIVNFSTVPITCAAGGVSQGSVIVDSVTGGTAPYDYNVTGTNGYDVTENNASGSTSISFDVVDFGLYQINVVDANGCSVLIQDVLVASPPTDLDIVINTTADCDPTIGGEAIVTVNTTLAGSGPFYFAIYDGTIPPPPPGAPWQLETSPGSITFTGLTTGVLYTFIVYDSLTGCSYFETATAPIPTNSTLTTDTITANNITCTGNADGNVSFNINNPEAININVDYQIFDSLSLAPVGPIVSGTVPAGGSLSVANLGPLPFGNYYVLITETSGPNAGCSNVTVPFNITESAIDLSLTASVSANENCNDLGVITAIASDGTAPYEYQILLDTDPTPIASDLNWNSANTFNVAANNYTVYAIDAYGCIRDFDISLIRDAEPTIDPQVAPCFVGTPITVTITGTVTIGNPSYSINGTAYSTNPDFTFATPGTYTLYIQDGNGCVATTPYVINDQLLLSADLTKELDCTATPNAEITLTATGGDNTTYTYTVDDGSGPIVMGSNIYSATTAGTYTFSVTDAANCVSTTTYTVDPIQPVTFTTVETNVSCNGDSDGSITVNITSGTGGPYMYQLDAGTPQTSNVFTGLAANTYTITVIDSNDCTYPGTPITITEPTPLTATDSVSVNTTCDSATIITVVGQDGTPTVSGDYYYDFNNTGFSTTNTYTVNNNGTTQTINYIVRDDNGCEVTGSVTVDPLNSPTDLDFSATPITCLVTTSTVTITTTGGDAPLAYEILSPASATTNVTGATSGIFTGLAPDNYIFQVTDASGCSYQELFVVDDVDNIVVSGQLISDVTCNPGTDGEVLFTVTNFTGTYSYSINGAPVITGQTNATISITGLTGPSTQTIAITDEVTGCTAMANIDVSQSTPLALIADPFVNANCNSGAQVSVTASGGSGVYTYSYVVSGMPAGTYTSSNTAVLDPAVSTTWDVYVQDANNCVISTPLTITIATDPIPTGITVTGSQCPSPTNDYTFTVAVATGIMPYEYSIGNGFQNSPTFTVNAPGTYTITVRDANGCTDTVTYTIEDPVGLTVTSVPPSCSDDDGELTVTGLGGTGTYTYAITPNPGVTLTGNVFSGVPSGTYTVTITDTVTLCTEDASVTLDAATPVTFTLDADDVTCNASSDGVITVTLPASNDNPTYTYEITAPIIVAPQTSNVFTGLIAGTYTVQVNSGKGCNATATIDVLEPAIITVPAPTVIEYACNAGTNTLNFATITVTGVTGGSGTYVNYEFIENATVVQFSNSNVYTESDLSGGTYTINVYDSQGCIGTTTATIVPYIGLDAIDVNVDTAITCTNLEDVTVTATTTGGIPTNIQYTIEDVVGTVIGGVYSQTNTTGVFTGLDIANYIITVENLDTGCSLETVHFVNDPNTFDITIDSVVDVTCFNDTDGSVNVTFIDQVISGTNPDQSGPFNYTVSDNLGGVVTTGTTANAGPITITGLAGGTYTIDATLVNNPFCTVSKSFTITQPTAALSVVASETSNVTCDNNLGSITAVATGGWSNTYEYELVLGATVIEPYSATSFFPGLSAGTYTVNVRDSEGCIASDTVTLDIPTPISATFIPSATLLDCFGDQNATITVNNVTGGQGGNYTYTLNSSSPSTTESGPQQSNVFTDLAAGTYSVTINDGFNCELTSADIVIDEPTPTLASLVAATTPTCLTQATLTLSASGGTGPYAYSNTPNFATVLGNFTTDITFNVAAGTYEYYVRDANGCIANVSNEITIVPIPNLDINLVSVNPTINCAGDNTGAITATAEGGLGNYVYTLEDTMGNPVVATQNSPGVFTELVAGTYVVTVDSGDCNTTSSNITITEPIAPLNVTFNTTDVTCSGNNNGVLEIIATGGTGIIKYAISPQLNQFFETNIFENLAPGTYDVIVQDVLGCFETFTFTITEPAPVVLTVVGGSVMPELCDGDSDGEFSIDIAGGTLPYSVSLDDINGVYTVGTATQTEFDFTGLSGGDHVVYILDDQGCASEWNITFPESVRIEPTVTIDYLCVNNVATNIVTVTVDDSITDLTDIDYSLNGGPYQASNIFNDVPAGTDNFIDVRHTNGCIQTTDFFDIIQAVPLTLTLSEGGLNEIVATPNGGSGGYIYTLNNEDFGSTNTFIITASGTYVVTVTDSSGCMAVASIEMEFIEVCIPDYFTPNNDGVQDGWTPGCAENYPNLEFDIFDRYGRVVAKLKVGEYWDGKYNDKELPTGDYWYVVRVNSSENDRSFVGHFTLYR